MIMLTDYAAFTGRHHETGTVHNALAYRGVNAPHTGQPPSEALLMGISGGITVGYFTFEYEGYPPHIVLLTRNTFDPLDTLFDRLAIPRDVRQTASAGKGEVNLIDVLESGLPAIVWADMFSLPYNDLPYDQINWGLRPLIVYGYEAGGEAHLADRAGVPLVIGADQLTAARARVKKEKFRVMTLDAPDFDKLPGAVSAGIWACIRLMTEAPPKGRRESFGLAALDHWAAMLTNTRNKASWARYFPAGERLWMALAGNQVQPGLYGWIRHAAGPGAERGLYADFLDEAAVILNRPGLHHAATAYRDSQRAWASLADALLPAEVEPLAEAAHLLDKKHHLFIEKGGAALAEIRAANARLNALREAATADFPMTEVEVSAFREGLAEAVTAVADAERDAVERLQTAMA